MKIDRPWPLGEKVRSPYGYRRHPITGRRKKHRGVDVGYNGPIFAPANGKVVHKGVSLNKRTGGGYTLILQHKEPKVWTVYYHLREPSPLSIGAWVHRGDIIAHTGTTGASTGVHLHFETRRSKRYGTDYDPEKILSNKHANVKNVDQPTVEPVRTYPKLVEDGRIGRNTWRAVQRMLASKKYYKGRITGRADRTTVRALQVFLNEGQW